MKILFGSFCLLAAVMAGGATTNSAPTAPKHDEIGLHSGHGRYVGATRQFIFTDHVVITNSQGRLSCERLTIYLPPDGAPDSHPTNAVAETNLDIIFVKKGETNHLVADKGIYDFSVVKGITNETFTFTGHATNMTAKDWMTGEPITWDNVKGDLDLGANPQVHHIGSGTNGSPFNIMQ